VDGDEVLDLGVVRDVAAPGELTGEGTLLGTPHYCAPEQAGGGPVDGRADIYALGVTVYEMLTGTVPFRGSEEALLAQHRDTPVPDVRWRAPEIPRSAAKAVASAMAKRPERRPRTADRLARTLELAAVPSAFRRLLSIG
jgi:serine/threonine protein kinase